MRVLHGGTYATCYLLHPQVQLGYETTANGWASDIEPGPDEVALCVRSGSVYLFATWEIHPLRDQSVWEEALQRAATAVWPNAADTAKVVFDRSKARILKAVAALPLPAVV